METSPAKSVKDYLANLPAERQAPMRQLREVLLTALPAGFEEQLSYGMLGFVVPHSRYPAGYHCDPKLPLPFLAIASQKASINLYHMGLYADPALLTWFTEAHAKASKRKLDMGKSCIRYKKPEDMPLALLAELASKMSVEAWIALYESKLKA